MPALAFMAQMTAPIIAGTKPFTLRRAWANGRTPDLDQRLDLVVNPRSPERRVFATAKVEFRATVTLVPEGIASVHNFRLARWHGPLALDVSSALVSATAPIPRQGGATMAAWSARRAEAAKRLAAWDGFEDFAAMYAFHNQHRPASAPRRIAREMIGLGLVTEAFTEKAP